MEVVASKLPSSDPLNQVILSWDFYTDICTVDDEESVNALFELTVGSNDKGIPHVPIAFRDEEEYYSTFFPLLLLETKMCIQRAKEMDMSKPIVVAQLDAAKKGNFFTLTLDRSYISENFGQGDLLLLYLSKQPHNEADTPGEFTENFIDGVIVPPDPQTDNLYHILAVVETCGRDNILVKIVIPQANKKHARRFSRLKKMMETIQRIGSNWCLCKVFSLVTVYREYQALMSFPDLLIKSDLLFSNKKFEDEAKQSDEVQTPKRKADEISEDPNERLLIPSKLKAELERRYNESQMQALQECLKSKGITLIQGPPGTGKTTTIVGVLSVLLNASVEKKQKNSEQIPKKIRQTISQGGKDSTKKERTHSWFRHWYDEMEYTMEDLLDQKPYREETYKSPPVGLALVEEEKPKRVLVCAPSNAAIDEILKRLVSSPASGGGLFDSEGKKFCPAVVRLGPNVHSDLKAWSLEQKAGQRLQAKGLFDQAAREAVKISIMKECKIVCSTLSVSGSRDVAVFPEMFDTVVIDEASQGVELSTLIPLRLGCRRLILVGDPRQLSATVFSQLAILKNYDQSLFQRLENVGAKINILSSQYRMHPTISRFSSEVYVFKNLIKKLILISCHFLADLIFKYLFGVLDLYKIIKNI
eukprot:GHVP01053500.1.p1 GENE.GHVP01053500.1~~GHVP01053500.1.p1  ORF type:complete len:651 (-),score=133.53 GHVP01053500.1:488-2419(-)